MRTTLTAVACHALFAASLSAQIPGFVAARRLTIGDSAGAPAVVFNRLSDARRLSDGRIVVAVCGDKQLRSFDATGKHMRTLSLVDSLMPAPRTLARIFTAGGDTLAAHEIINSRLSLIGPDLSMIGVGRVPNPLPPRTDGRPLAFSPLDVIGRFADGTFVGRLQVATPPSVSDVPPDTGIQRRKLSLFRFDAAGTILDSLPSLPGMEHRTVPRQPGGGVRLGRTTVFTVLPDRLIVGDQAAGELVEYDTRLRLVRRIPTITKPLPVTDSIRAVWTSIANARTNFPVNGVIPAYGPAYAEAVPAFRDLVGGTDGRVWVQDPADADSYPLIWTAYRDARPVARAELPPRFYPTQFGPDWVLGLAFDTTKVERVQLLTLARGTPSGRRFTPREAAPANRPQCGAWVSR